MRKKLIFLILGGLVGFNGLGKLISRDEIRSKYPYGILTEDYGILSEEDFRINTCIAKPEPFSETKMSNYPIWQSFEVRDLKIYCEGNTYDPDEGSRMTSLVISMVRNKAGLQEYFIPKPMKIQECKEFIREWDNYTLNEKYICLCGSLPQVDKERGGKKVTSWVFNRFKTKKGCDSYAEGQCDLNYHRAARNCPRD